MICEKQGSVCCSLSQGKNSHQGHLRTPAQNACTEWHVDNGLSLPTWGTLQNMQPSCFCIKLETAIIHYTIKKLVLLFHQSVSSRYGQSSLKTSSDLGLNSKDNGPCLRYLYDFQLCV